MIHWDEGTWGSCKSAPRREGRLRSQDGRLRPGAQEAIRALISSLFHPPSGCWAACDRLTHGDLPPRR